MATLRKITIKNFKSINNKLEISIPSKCPLVLIGENNAGKSNIIQAINTILGETYPKYFSPEDNDFYDRDTTKIIEIIADFSPNDPLGSNTTQLILEYDPSAPEDPCSFQNQNGRWPKNEDRDKLLCIIVDADRRLNYQLSYKSKYTLLSKLMRKFHSHLRDKTEVIEDLKDKFEEIKELFNELDEFANFSRGLKKSFTGLSSGMTHRLEVDFSAYDPTKFFHSLRLQAEESGQVRSLSEIGTGEEQVLALALAHSYAKAFHEGVLLAIEEPEAHLHPLAQEYLARKIEEMCNDGLQIILTTHSPTFVNVENSEGIVLVRKNENGTHTIQKDKSEFVEYCTRHGVPENASTVNKIGPFYSANATKEIIEGVFAKKVVLVEGPTESLSLPIYLNEAGLNTKKLNIAIIPVHGKGNIAKWWRFFTLYQIPTYIIFDNDTDDDGDGKHRLNILETIGVESTNFDGFLNEDEILIRDKFTDFGKDYETAFRALFTEYEEIEDEARDIISSGAKPFTARYVAKKLVKNTDIKERQGWNKLIQLANKIDGLSINENQEINT